MSDRAPVREFGPPRRADLETPEPLTPVIRALPKPDPPLTDAEKAVGREGARRVLRERFGRNS